MPPVDLLPPTPRDRCALLQTAANGKDQSLTNPQLGHLPSVSRYERPAQLRMRAGVEQSAGQSMLEQQGWPRVGRQLDNRGEALPWHIHQLSARQHIGCPGHCPPCSTRRLPVRLLGLPITKKEMLQGPRTTQASGCLSSPLSRSFTVMDTSGFRMG